MENVISISQASASPNRRSHPRKPCALNVNELGGARFAARDISLGGARILTDREPIISSRIPFSLKDSSGRIYLQMNGEVVWTKENLSALLPWETGIKFVDVTQREWKNLRHLIYNLERQKKLGQHNYLPLVLVHDKEELDSIVQNIRSHELNDLICASARRCAEISKRPTDLWKWCSEGVSRTTLSSVPPEWCNPAQSIKLLSIILFTTIDDIADVLKDRTLMRDVLRQVFGQSISDNGDNSQQSNPSKPVDQLGDLWKFIKKYIQTFPRYLELKHLFYFDYSNLLRTVEHAMLVNERPELINEIEGVFHQGYGVHIIPNLTFDLMCSPTLDANEIGKIREIGWFAQQMCRIANWLVTWKLELRDKDYTSGVVALALKRGVINVTDLKARNGEELIERIEKSDVENELLSLWGKYWTQVHENSNISHAIDVSKYLEGIEYFFKMQVACDKILYYEPTYPSSPYNGSPSSL